MKHYILNQDKIIQEVDLMTWLGWRKTDNKRLFKDSINNYIVSTVFLGIDHRIGFENDNKSDPVLFETMVFDNGEEVFCERYTSYQDAKSGHERVFKDYMKIQANKKGEE